MPIRREFLDWRKPALAEAAEFLRCQFAHDNVWDLSGVIVVVPGGRAGRRLLEILVAVAEQHQLLLTPPTIVTPEAFPELLYEARWPFADTLTQQLAWCEALRRAPRELQNAFLPFPPEPNDTPRWLAIGETLRRLHVELAADGLDCREVVKGATKVDGFAEHDRWETLCKLQRAYLDVLDRLELWDIQTARLVAIKNHEIVTDKQVVLVGTVDLNRAQRQMLDQIADRVTTLAFAAGDMKDRFDEHGCLIPGKWTAAELPLADDQIERVDGPAEQTECVTTWLASLQGRYRADQISIGLPDEKLVPHLDRQLTQCGLSGRWPIAKQLAETGPYRLLKVAADYAARKRFRDLAALVRHPDVYEWLADRKRQRPQSGCHQNILDALDCFASERFPAQLDPERLAKEESAKQETSADVLAIHRAVEELTQALLHKPRPLTEWSEPMRSLLATIYGARTLDRDQPRDRFLAKSLEAIAQALDNLSHVPPELQPVVDARQAARIVLAQLAGEGIPPPADPDSIELLGWLDLPLDDAPAAIVTTFNEGFVPASTTADAYLPNRLREALGLMHNDRRLARDAYSLALLVASRQDFKVIVARRDSQANPLAPSRLLFLNSPENIVARACQFFGEPPPSRPRRNLLAPPGAPPSEARLTPPLPERLANPIAALSVTKFRDFLACPYRFYLRHMLGLECISDEAEELDGGTFGGLVHLVLEQFGRAEDSKKLRTEGNPDRIAEYLQDKLSQYAAARFGKQSARPAVLLQIEQIRLRLGAFAHRQAARTRDGWRIVFSEDSDDPRLLKFDWPVDGKPFTLQGRIDRIDYHESQRKLCVVDYKTADRGDHPHRTHRHGDDWIDLQLPLYRHLVRAANLPAGIPPDAPVELGYIVLPLDLKSAGLLLAEWDEATLRTADETAREIVRAIRDEAFWPIKTPPPDFFDDVAVICQDRGMAGIGMDDAAA